MATAEVRLEAEDLELECQQPEDANDPDFIASLQKRGFDLGVVVSYGVIMSADLFNVPEQGCINAHASLLPLYRGAAPIQHAIKDGHTETGISIMKIEEKLDAGPVMQQDKTEIGARETAGELRTRLAEAAGKSLVKALKQIDGGKAKFKPQDHDAATWARMIEKPDGAAGIFQSSNDLRDRRGATGDLQVDRAADHKAGQWCHRQHTQSRLPAHERSYHRHQRHIAEAHCLLSQRTRAHDSKGPDRRAPTNHAGHGGKVTFPTVATAVPAKRGEQ